jgi:hypothetical protein
VVVVVVVEGGGGGGGGGGGAHEGADKEEGEQNTKVWDSLMHRV